MAGRTARIRRGTRQGMRLLVALGCSALGWGASTTQGNAQAPQPAICTAAQKADPATAQACAANAPSTTAAPAASAPSAAKRFPFPGEDADVPTGPGAKPAATPDAPSAPRPGSAAAAHPYPGEPDAGQATSPAARSAAGAHPYPGDPDAAKDAKDPASDGFSSSSSSSSGASDPNDADSGPLKDAGSSGDDTKTPAKGGRRRKLPKIDAQTPEARESEDLDVAGFYMETGNAAGAYARAKDAVSLQPADPFAQFALAEAARKLGKPDEAREHYGKVLDLDPNDKQLRLTKKALAELGPAGPASASASSASTAPHPK